MESQERLSLISGHMAFPDSLKRLSLEDSRIPWEDMTVVGSLPNLEVLKLWSYAFEGPEWNSKEEQFPRLKVLYIFESDLAWWRAESSHFPNLQRLILRRMAYLNEIPSDIGDIATLRSIQVYRCSRSAAISAKQIEREQHDNCNELEVHVNSRLPKMWKPVFNVLRFAFRLTKLSGYVPPREKVGSIVEES
ncbi:UNVERIFIED_CONTAM: hypothetical protein Sradi_4064900 [Sesamum radiatum]|uniref:Uncharacterized protein n=1 Tax=Sesamum radiatum TaxID=300843 RepID=A0AAW2PJ17_SESRA